MTARLGSVVPFLPAAGRHYFEEQQRGGGTLTRIKIPSYRHCEERSNLRTVPVRDRNW
ncbi:hypothetical protein [Mucilaginibacter ginsenosidivorans]|uniref:hypothetical protein n=1 Tax=Mucilaginibacter ginsenosidivorans TaxID=398053 RepID=UPI003672B01D